MRRQCEAATVKGGQCRRNAVAYHQHGDGGEYLVCAEHRNYQFKPARQVIDRRLKKSATS